MNEDESDDAAFGLLTRGEGRESGGWGGGGSGSEEGSEGQSQGNIDEAQASGSGAAISSASSPCIARASEKQRSERHTREMQTGGGSRETGREGKRQGRKKSLRGRDGK